MAAFDVIDEVVSYMRYLAQSHIKIEGFLIGEGYELNNSNITYPLLYLQFPLDVEPFEDRNGEKIRLRFQVGVYTNKIEDEFGNSVIIREDSVSIPYNEINSTELKPQDKLVRNCMRYMSHLIAKTKRDFENGPINGTLSSSPFRTAERLNDDDVYGAITTIELVLGDGYGCEYLDFFVDPTQQV